MSYPPVGGGFPPNGPHPNPPPAPRSPWSSPPVLVAMVAGILVVIAGVLAAIVLIPEQDSDSDSAAAPSATSTSSPSPSAPAPSGSSAGGSGPTDTTPSGVTPSGTTPSGTTPSDTTRPSPPTPDVPGTDVGGFISGPRCNVTEDPLIMVADTGTSQMIVCQVGTQAGRWYYKAVSGPGPIELDYPTRAGNTFIARNGDGTTYTVSPTALIITDASGGLVSSQPMRAFWAAP
ncbi:hypothetical protein QSJ18_10390 [Gordonia sp. ABSL1-1]|uniref:hypothetical protein n=1 Tax=Gordonia sp. ABSL1-1 TaxID=3053923 RepID=UPI0025743F99|nr:hypothetical protein [Gordonia sp. ABSL1-1]MDL9937151.1 hypothetical protein [Gordonia sp. ABSL1-1]